MIIKADSPEEYIRLLPEERKEPMKKLRSVILKHLPDNFEETISYGMIGYVVPHSIYPKGYHVDPALPLPFMSIASQKNHIAVYHYGIYSDNKLLEWFKSEYPKHSDTKLDMGKSCIRFHKPDRIPFELIGKLTEKMTPEEWIELYEQSINR